MKKLKIGLVGSGWWSDAMYCPALHDYEDAEIVAISGTNREALDRLANRWNIPATYHGIMGWKEMMCKEDLDGIIIASSTHTHYDIASYALDKGIHVLCEKPLTAYTAQATRLATKAKVNNLVANVAFTYYYMPDFQALRNIMEKHQKPSILNMYWNSGFMVDAVPAAKSNLKLGNNVCADVVCHYVFLASMLLGEIKSTTLCSLDYHPELIETENYIPSPVECYLILHHENGSMTRIFFTSMKTMPNEFNMQQKMELKIEGQTYTTFNDWDKGLTLQTPTELIDLANGKTVKEVYHNIFRKNNTGMVREFVTDILANESRECSFENALKVQRVVDILWNTSLTPTD